MPKKRGCLFYLGVVAGLSALAGLLLAVLVVSGIRGLIRDYTGTAPVAMPAMPEVPEAELAALVDKSAAFHEAIKAPGGGGGAALELGEAEISALLFRQPELREKVRVGFPGDAIKIQASVPLSGSGIPFTGGRFLNAEVVLKASMDDGVMIATLDSVQLNGQPMPEALMAGLRSENMAKELYRRPQTAEALRKFESLRVKDGRLSIRLRP